MITKIEMITFVIQELIGYVKYRIINHDQSVNRSVGYFGSYNYSFTIDCSSFFSCPCRIFCLSEIRHSFLFATVILTGLFKYIYTINYLIKQTHFLTL